MSNLYGVIPAAGEGLRARPDSLTTPKALFEINGSPLLQRNIELMRDQVGIRNIVIVTGHLGSLIEEYFGDGSNWGVQLHFIRNQNLERGLAWSIYLSRERVEDYFCVILADECYFGSNHHQLTTGNYRQAVATCAVKRKIRPVKIQENYGVRVDDNGAISRLIEKPVRPENDLLGCGTFMLSPSIFPLLEEVYTADGYHVEFISFLNTLCKKGHPLLPFWLEGGYVNVNDRNGLQRAALQNVLLNS